MGKEFQVSSSHPPPFSTLKMLFHYLLVLIIFFEKSAFSLITAPLKENTLCSLTAFIFIFIFSNLTITYFGIFCLSCECLCLSFWAYWTAYKVSCQIWKLLNHFSSNISLAFSPSSLFWDSNFTDFRTFVCTPYICV